MIKSMTGFGAANAEIMGYRARLELRTLNNRHREYVFRGPHFLGSMEEAIKKEINKRIARGRIELLLQMEPNKTQNAQEIIVNLAAARDLHAKLTRLSEELNLPDPVNLSHLLKEDKLFVMSDAVNLDPQAPELLESILNLAGIALEQLVTMRLNEGRSLKNDILLHLENISLSLQTLRGIAANIPAIVTKRYRLRLEELAETLIDPDRLAQEAAILGEKLDITEEITRFATHAQSLGTLVESGEPVGRRLEFLLQELLREANTMGSKSQSLQITEIVLSFKSELEKIREQVLNIE
ncbi:MAG: YicC family protein [Deltaproteobacteria bacterium]|jgi:uncharacterized protein (TIGR00255 family)|nr:YicC family protein [Deltaproteobacteria bacterium]